MLITTTKCLSSLISRAGSSALQILVQPPTTPWPCRYCRRGPAHARADGPRGAAYYVSYYGSQTWRCSLPICKQIR